MITRCNRCGAKFEISADLVRSQDPTVRCGECLSLFDASAHLIPDDSISNYVTDPAPNRRRTDKPQSTTTAAGTVKRRTTPQSRSAGVVAAEHITAEDLENASTLALDLGPADDENIGAAPAASDRSNPRSRINDGFYSPDLDINQYESGARFKHSQQPDDRRDSLINQGESLDNSSLEFERTLALEKFNDTEVVPGSGPTADDYSSDVAAFSPSEINDFNSELPTNVTYDETVRLEQTDDLTAEYYPADNPVRGEEYRAERSAGQSTSEYTDTAIDHGRDYPLLPEDLLDRGAIANDADDALTDQLPLQPEALYYDEQPVGEGAEDYNRVEDDELNDSHHERRTDRDSARELRRYVSSRGGAVYPEGAGALNRQGSRSVLVPVLLVCVALAGVLYFARNVIATMNLPEPVVSVFCTVTGCELPARKDIDQLELVRHQMFSHKTLSDVLVFSVDLVNRARFPQPYPVLVVTMANGTGESVAFRKFEPAEYLEEEASLKTLPAGEPVRIKFEIVDPGPEALSSELSFE